MAVSTVGNAISAASANLHFRRRVSPIVLPMQNKRVTYPTAKLLAVAFALVQLSLLAACKSNRTTSATHSGFRVALLTPGSVSDAGWNAAAFNGLQLIRKLRVLIASRGRSESKRPRDHYE